VASVSPRRMVVLVMGGIHVNVYHHCIPDSWAYDDKVCVCVCCVCVCVGGGGAGHMRRSTCVPPSRRACCADTRCRVPRVPLPLQHECWVPPATDAPGDTTADYSRAIYQGDALNVLITECVAQRVRRGAGGGGGGGEGGGGGCCATAADQAVRTHTALSCTASGSQQQQARCCAPAAPALACAAAPHHALAHLARTRTWRARAGTRMRLS
jgi:hypothetical protein